MKIIETKDEVVIIEGEREVQTLETSTSSIISDQERYADTFEHQFQSGPPGIRGNDGKDAYEVALDEGFVGTRQEWLDHLGTQTPETPYESAVRKGFTGTEDEWLESLRLKATVGDAEKILTNDGSETLWMTLQERLNSDSIEWDLGEI